MNHYLLRRKNRIISLILVVGTIFLLFQLFSFKVLNFTASRSIKFGGKHSGIVLGDVKDDTLVNNGNAADRANKDKDMNLKFQKQKVNNEVVMRNAEQDHAVHVAEGLEELDLPKGVQMMQMNEYKRRADGMFQCLKSKEFIPYSDVNDDYCDCGDSSDEPGTSACPESRFYCTFQYPDVAPLYITGSRVNDGVCDCCDGSDEWLGLHVFSGVHLTDKRLKDSLTHAPCKDTCLAVQKSNEDDARIRAMGKRLKQAYILAGKKATDKHLYGPDGVFYQLSLSCFHVDISEYKYSLCPFKSVTQQKFPDAAKTIGKSPEWKIKLANKGIYVLKMDKGETSGCPSSTFRNTVVTFICGLTDKILQVSEEEKCAYSMKFSTPAAC